MPATMKPTATDPDTADAAQAPSTSIVRYEAACRALAEARS
jgi:hypothetical protein